MQVEAEQSLQVGEAPPRAPPPGRALSQRLAACLSSPSQGPCCTFECSYKGRNEKCREESECAHQGMCNGVSAQCPTSEPKANFTACHGETQVCLNGVRSGRYSNAAFAPVGVGASRVLMLLPHRAAPAPSARSTDSRRAPVPARTARTRRSSVTCAAWRRVSHAIPFYRECSWRGRWITLGCFLLPAVNPNTCSSTRSERLARFFNKKEITLPAGSPCNEFKGYCDVFMKCRLVDADGPLARLKKAIFNPELYENIAEWIVVRVWSATADGARVFPSRRGAVFKTRFPSSLLSRLTGGLCY